MLLKNNHHGDAVLLLVRYGGFWGFCLFAGFRDMILGILEDYGYNYVSENPAQIFPLLFQYLSEKSENKSIKD